MGRRLIVFGFAAAVLLSTESRVLAEEDAPPGQITVNEVAARITLLDNRIRLELPFAAAVPAGTSIAARILSPINERLGQTEVALPGGSRRAQLTLDWPRDAKGNPVDKIGWYRIGYEVRTNGALAAHGILSIGAITPNLLALRVARPQALVTGVPIRLRVFAGNPVTGEAFRGVRLNAKLTFDADSDEKGQARQPMVRSAVTGDSGEAVLVFPGLQRPGEEASLTIQGELTGRRIGAETADARATVTIDLDTRDLTVFHTETDKPLHKPGETVHLRTLVLNDAGRAAANVPLTLTIKDAEDKKVIEVPLTTNQFGIAAYDWKTTPQTPTGSYTANFDEDDTSSYGQNADFPISIERYEMPEFNVTAEMDRSFYLQGQVPVLRVHAGYLFGKPVAAGTVKVVRAGENDRYSRTGSSHENEKTIATGSLDANGDASFPIDVKEEFDGLASAEYERFRDLQFRAMVTDASTGRSEPRNFTVRISRYPVHIYLSEPEGDAREGDVLVSTSYADGSPAGCDIQLDWMEENSKPKHAGTAITNQYGLARVHLHYPAAMSGDDPPEFNLRVTARDPEGRISQFDDTLRPSDTRIRISVARSLLRPGEAIQGSLHGEPGSLVDIDVLSDTEILDHLQIRLRHPAEPFTVPSDPRFRGVLSIRGYRFTEEEPGYDTWMGTSVLYPEDRELRLKAIGMKPSYPPGALVDASLRLSSVAPRSSLGAIGVTVFDSAVAQRADTEEDANSSSFDSRWWMEAPTAGGLTLADLNKVDTSKPIPEDLELAAEAVLADVPENEVEIEGESDLALRNVYSTQMEQDLKPLGEALEKVSAPHLPSTFEAVHQVARDAGIDAGLLDPWNSPYKVERSTTAWNESIALVSAGLDKKFGTDDDLTINLAQRNPFAVPGAVLNRLLTAAAAAGRALPANADQLKTFARAGGLDLDSTTAGTRTLDGRPYKYKVDVQRRLYHVDVDDGETQVWTSASIDYFSSSEARMDAALRAWNDAGKGFPANEAEARQVFKAAGIDFDALRDPVGLPFELRVEDTFAYTVHQRVQAGADLHVTNRPVTEKMRAIEVLRTPSASAGEPAPAPQMVAQFLHSLTEQSGSDLNPQPSSQGTFKAYSGAIAGTVTDQTGAVISGAIITIRSSTGKEISATSDRDGIYLIRDLAPGLYRLTAIARGFQSFQVYEIRVSAESLTTVDLELRVGTATETVAVEASAMPLMQTSAASVTRISRAVAGPDRKTILNGQTGRAVISEPEFTPRLRRVFDETAYWAPSLLTSANGRAALRFRLPDSLTTWKLHALASTVDGRIGVLDQTFQTFQPLFIDLDAPQALTVGDEITLPVNLRNYTSQPLALRLTVKPSDWFQLTAQPASRIAVPAGASVPWHVALRAAAPADAGALQLTAADSRDGDAVEKKVFVHADGQPRAIHSSSLLRGASTTLTLDLPADLIPGSLHSELRLYPNLGAELVQSMKAAIERPYGCGEQTISSSYPNLLLLELLKRAQASSDLEPTARQYLQLGYDRLQDYFDRAGGLTYWGGGGLSPDPALTAYGLEFLLDARPFLQIDSSRIQAAIRWLLSVQQSDGSWTVRDGSPDAELTLYIARSLTRAVAAPSDLPEDLRQRVLSALARAVQWAGHSAEAANDPYANALRLDIASAAGDASSMRQAREALLAVVEHDRGGAHWSRSGASPFYGWGRAGDLETTALVFSALQQRSSAEDRTLLDDVLFFLLGNRDRYGVWSSGQATTRVLQALLPIAIQQLKQPSGTAAFSVVINGAPLDQNLQDALRADTRRIDAPRTLDVSPFLKPGRNELAFSGSAGSALSSAEVVSSFYTPWTADAVNQTATTTPGKDFGLDFGYRCQAEGAKADQPVTCTVDARHFGSQLRGMMLAEVGLPPGADVDRTSLAKLLDAGTISRYELQPDRLVFYLWPRQADGVHFSFRFTPRYPIRAKAAPATLTDYYNPDMQVVLAPQSFQVQ